MKTDRRGFSLLEAVVALFIVGITAIAAMEAVGTDLRAHEKAQRMLEAESLAEHQLSMVRMLYFEDFQAFPDSLSHGQFEWPFESYRYSTRVEPVVNEENLFRVDMDVTWPDGNYNVTTMVYRRPQEMIAAAGGAGRGGGGDRGGGGGRGGAGRDGGGGRGDAAVRGGGGNRGGGGVRGGGGRGGGGRGAARGGTRGGGGGRGGATTGGRTTTRDTTRDTTRVDTTAAPWAGGSGGGVQ